MNATPVYEIDVYTPANDLPVLKEKYPDAADDLVSLHVTYTAGTDSLEEVLRELEGIFPRWYARDWKETGALGPALTPGEPVKGKSFEETVRDYVKTELLNHSDEEQAEVMGRLEALFGAE